MRFENTDKLSLLLQLIKPAFEKEAAYTNFTPVKKLIAHMQQQGDWNAEIPLFFGKLLLRCFKNRATLFTSNKACTGTQISFR